MKKRIIVQGRLNDAQLAHLAEHFEVCAPLRSFDPTNPEVRSALEDVHGIIGASMPITPEFLDAAPALEVIALVSVGYDTVPVDELTKRGILLCNTPDVLTETTADTGFALIMTTARRVVELATWVKAGAWEAGVGTERYGSDVHGKTLGMVGFGRIGQAVARRGALGFNMKVLYSNASPKPDVEKELGATRRELDQLLAESDFVCVTVPLTPETEKLIGADELARMKSSAILVNIARGKVIDEAALIDALERGVIQGAGLDVFEREPLADTSPLPGMANVVALPHIGSATHETRTAMAQRAVDNLRLALTGEAPISPVNAEVLA
ncbi:MULTISPECIES: D-glycerate dehydrogenase [unclassified Halomonas]|uniref:2-hydroxyacid dehydrogenase n=1 Tax=unclassified Halomonas TaxID=2609666 RepID=UPI00209C83F3|nr:MULTISPECIES: D-glycerate dehydrogenase [unclassified Halomonas]MCP1315442.1 D-glycerate dehydrogenase [Halomonas sp. 707D7]MCP1326788.1 D-glycerate dehydrogenase [Halomonas sp. 707D4]